MKFQRDAGSGVQRTIFLPAKKLLLFWVLVAAAFPLAAFLAPSIAPVRTGYEHALLDLGIALSACFCSLQAMMRYQSRPQPMFLWLAAGFLASGLLDGIHAMLSLQPYDDATGVDRVGWSWTASATVLGACLVLTFGRTASAERNRRPLLDMTLAGVVPGIGVAVLVPVLLNAPLARTLWPDFALHRPWQLVPALLYAAAFVLAWRRRDMIDAPLRRMLFASLILYVSLHAGVMAWSARPLDAFAGLAHLARFLAHWLILMGLLQTSATMLVEAEDARRRLATQAEALEGSERRIRSIVHHAPYAILSADESGAVRDINPVAASIFHIVPEQARGRPLTSFFAMEVREELDMALGGEQAVRARLLQMKQAQGDETGRFRNALSRVAPGVRSDGSTFPASLTLTDSVAGGQRFLTAFVRDLTRAIEQEQKIQQALALTSQILDQSGAAICSTDASGLITRFNHTAQAWLGYSEKEACSLTPASFIDPKELQAHGKWLEREHDITPTTDSETLLALARRGMPDQREWTLVSRDGRRLPSHVAVAPLADEHGQVNGFVLVASDLSHRKEVEQLKNEFVSTVSHELRTPLTSVRGSLGLLAGGLAGKLPAQAQSLLQIAQRNTERLILLINDILDMEKIEAGKMRFNFKSVELDALAAEAVQSAEGLASTRSVKLALRQRLPGVRVHADDQRLMQVMSNLLSNAIKFSPTGGTVDIDVTDVEGQARFTVVDHGAGIPEAAQPRIFQKFFQADSSSAREKSGTGLGLSICKALVERMDGQMRFTSRPGETVFWFELPRSAAAAAGEAASAGRVLIIEDDSDAAAVLGQILGQAGYEFDVAKTAAQGREGLQKRRYDCVLLDVLLPDQHGLTLLGELRRLDHGRNVPIVIVSVYDPDDAAQAVAAASRVATWLTKPVAAPRLLDAVRAALPARSAPPAVAQAGGSA